MTFTQGDVSLCFEELFQCCIFYYCRIHHGQITSNQMLLPVIDRLRKVTVEKVTSLRVGEILFLLCLFTVKPVSSGHSKSRPKLVFKTDYRLMQVKRFAECSKGSILQYFPPSLSYHLPLRPLFCLFLSGCLRQVFLYLKTYQHHVASQDSLSLLKCKNLWYWS